MSDESKPRSDRGEAKRVVAVVAGLVMLAAAVLLTSGVMPERLGSLTRNASTVEGRIISSEVTSQITQRRSAFRSGRYREQKRYKPDVAYEYTVHGETFQGNRIQADDHFVGVLNYRQAQEIADRYPAGKMVEVHFVPDNPELAALETGTHSLYGLAVAFLIIGGGLALTQIFWLLKMG
jgi:hypothetical protein